MATAGPTSLGKESELFEAGATCIRLNASHLTPSEVFEHCRRITALSSGARCVVDLQGAKMRLGDNAPRQVRSNEPLWLSCSRSNEAALYVPHPELFEQARCGEWLSVDDGRLLLEVGQVQPSSLCVRANRDYLLLPRKGVNRQHHPFDIQDLNRADAETVRRCQVFEAVSFAISFAKTGDEVAWVRRRAPHARVVLKVERREALNQLERMARNADELWICRGDLGAQLGIFELGEAIRHIDPAILGIPVLMAGQVLEHLTQHEEPTRSEVCHLDDLLARQYAGIVLSDETAIGHAPAMATRWAHRLLHPAEYRQVREQAPCN